MKRIRRLLLWYIMFMKRLLKRPSFWMILLMIPLAVIAMRFAIREESGILTVALCAEDPEDEAAREVLQMFMESESILQFVKVETPEEAEHMVKVNRADTAWVFCDRFAERVKAFTSAEGGDAVIRVLEREENIMMHVSREMMFGRVYRYLCQSVYEGFVTRQWPDITVSTETLPETYDKNNDRAKIMETEFINEGYAQNNENINYLNAPIRGMLSLLVILATLAAGMYFLADQEEGRYDWMSYEKRLRPAFGSCFAAATLSGIAVLVAVMLSGIRTAIWIELIAMMLFILSATGFGFLMATIFRSPGKLGASLPFFIISMLALCPIFFNVKMLPAIRLLLPPTYYLRSVYEPRYLGYAVVYTVSVYALTFVVNLVLNRNERGIR